MVKKKFQCVFEIDSKDDEFNENGAFVYQREEIHGLITLREHEDLWVE